MEPNRNSNNNGGDEHEQLQKSERKRTFNELTNDEDKPAAGEEDPNCTNSKKNREEGKDLDLESYKLETSTTTMVDLPRGHRKLPAELNREIYLCFNSATQLKFIGGLGWDFYAMFRYRLLTKFKRVRNSHGNRWNNTNTTATIAADGLSVSIANGFSNVFAVQPFPISGPLCRADDFPGTILYYYEVKANICDVGLSGAIDNSWIGGYPNSYAVSSVFYYIDGCWLAGVQHHFELPEGAIQPEEKEYGNVYGCGLVLDPDNKLAIFFTLNDQLLGRKIPITPTVDRLFPAVSVWGESSIEANFGDDPAEPFVYDIQKCTGLGLASI